MWSDAQRWSTYYACVMELGLWTRNKTSDRVAQAGNVPTGPYDRSARERDTPAHRTSHHESLGLACVVPRQRAASKQPTTPGVRHARTRRGLHMKCIPSTDPPAGIVDVPFKQGGVGSPARSERSRVSRRGCAARMRWNCSSM